MLAFRDMLFDPPPGHPRLDTFFLEVVLGPHLDLLARSEMLRPEHLVYPLLAARLRAKLALMAGNGDTHSSELLDKFPLQMTPDERAGLSAEEVVATLKRRVLEVLCRML
jgi:hypothetical protein